MSTATDAEAGELPEWLSLEEGETVEWIGQPASISVLPAVVVGIPFILFLGLGLLIIAGAVLSVRNTDYVVTDRSLYVKQGVLSTNIESVGLDKIQNTEFRQSFLGKQFDYGSIDVSTAGSSGAEITFRAVEGARDVRELVNRLSNQYEDAGAATGESEADVPSADWAEELIAELTATREALENVERALRESEGGDPGTTWSDDDEVAESSVSPSTSEADDVE
jgi:uncharacterized membrane protein YdbT with pleckstrin-like domain